MREKLIGLIRKADKEDYESRTQDEHYGFMADRLTESGVVIPVRCKDCKHYTEGMAVGMCKRDPQKPIMPMTYNNYCGFAERKDNET